MIQSVSIRPVIHYRISNWRQKWATSVHATVVSAPWRNIRSPVHASWSSCTEFVYLNRRVIDSSRVRENVHVKVCLLASVTSCKLQLFRCDFLLEVTSQLTFSSIHWRLQVRPPHIVDRCSVRVLVRGIGQSEGHYPRRATQNRHTPSGIWTHDLDVRAVYRATIVTNIPQKYDLLLTEG